jgi:hypothetical protein
MEDLIGKKVIGFAFKDNLVVGWNDNMNEYVGEIGEITEFSSDKTGAYYVQFSSNAYWYPALGIKEQFIEKEPEIELSLKELINNVKNIISKI